jgi:hypothetical protein
MAVFTVLQLCQENPIAVPGLIAEEFGVFQHGMGSIG